MNETIEHYAKCTKCGAQTLDPRRINEPCSKQMANGKRCTGTYRSDLRPKKIENDEKSK